MSLSHTKSQYWEREVDEKISWLIKKPFACNLLEKINQFSLMMCSWGYQPHSRTCLMPERSWPSQKGLHRGFLWSFCFILCSLGSFCLTEFFNLFSFLVLFCVRKNINLGGWECEEDQEGVGKEVADRGGCCSLGWSCSGGLSFSSETSQLKPWVAAGWVWSAVGCHPE